MKAVFLPEKCCLCRELQSSIDALAVGVSFAALENVKYSFCSDCHLQYYIYV